MADELLDLEVAVNPSWSPSPKEREALIADGTLEAAKWIALGAMTVDHVNTYLLAGTQPWMYHLGRLAMPLFGIVVAAHLARPNAFEAGLAARMIRRLAIVGVAAQFPFLWLRGGPWPPTLLNIMFTLLVAVAFAELRRQKRRRARVASWAVFLVGGALVEFWWFGAALVLAVHAWFRHPTVDRAFIVAAAFAPLVALTGSPVPLVAPAVILGLRRLRVVVRRRAFVFYAYYPAHLAVLLLLKNAGAVGVAVATYTASRIQIAT